MSVPKYKRSESSTEFMKELYELNKRCGQIIMKQPNKYRQNYGDFLIQSCLRALQCAQMANSIYVCESTEEYMMHKREELFYEVIELCGNIPTTAHVFFDLTKSVEGYKNDCAKYQMFFAEKCVKITTLIKGVIESDKKRYASYKK